MRKLMLVTLRTKDQALVVQEVDSVTVVSVTGQN